MHGGNNRGAGARLVWRPGLEAAWKARRLYIERLHRFGLKAPGGRLPNAAKLRTKKAAVEELLVEAIRRIKEVGPQRFIDELQGRRDG